MIKKILNYIIGVIPKITSNLSSIIPCYLLLYVNEILPNTESPQNSIIWLYNQFIPFLGRLLTLEFIAIFVFLFLIKTFLIVWINQDFFLLFQEKRKSLFSSFLKIRFRSILFFLTSEIIVYICFTLISFLFYIVTKQIWIYTDSTSLVLSILGVFFLLLYPIFYILISITATISVLSLDIEGKLKRISWFFEKNNFKTIYAFYFTRLTIECIFAIIMPIIIALFIGGILKFIIGAFLMIPLFILRLSSFKLKLDILKIKSS